MPPPRPHWFDGRSVLYHGDCLDVLRDLPDAIFDAVVTDPPYELGFMGRAWDASGVAYNVDLWKHALRVLKPGGHLLAFGGTRTYHRLACAVEDAGFEIRDSISWLYGSGFPKSLDVSKAIDKAAGAEREVVGSHPSPAGNKPGGASLHMSERGMPASAVITAPATDDAKRWDGWGTALKPAHEPIVVARKPLSGTVAQNVLTHGTGALNIDGCRIDASDLSTRERKAGAEFGQGSGWNAHENRDTIYDPSAGRWPTNVVLDEDAAAELDAQSGTLTHEPIVVARRPLVGTVAQNVLAHGTGALNIDGCRVQTDEDTRRNARGGDNGLTGSSTFRIRERRADDMPERDGRWPTNVVLDEDAAAELDAQSGTLTSGANPTRRGSDKFRDTYGEFAGQAECTPARGADSGGASRFFPTFRYQAKAPTRERPKVDGVAHPTVKPLELMRWLVRLVTPANGLVLDPFAGSGTTLEAARCESFRAVGIERDAPYLPLILARMERS